MLTTSPSSASATGTGAPPDRVLEIALTDIHAEALRKGRPGYAAVDVFEDEPVVGGHALLKMPNAVCTPHLGYVVQSTYELYYATVIDSILAYASGKPANVINPEALSGK